MRTCLARLPHQLRGGLLRRVAIERRDAQRAVGLGADQSGQRDLVSTPQ